jgi:hypothetical protein
VVMTKKSEEAKEMKKHARPKMEKAKVQYDSRMKVPRMGGEPEMEKAKKEHHRKKSHAKGHAAHEKAEMMRLKDLEKMHKKHLADHHKHHAKHHAKKAHKGK